MDQEKDRSSEILEKMALASIEEQRRSRRWGIFFKLLLAIYLFGFFILFQTGSNMQSADKASRLESHTALIDLNGAIAGYAATNADTVSTALRAAFEEKNAKAILLRINSPGGTPVQAGYIYDEIDRLQMLHPDKPVYAVITEVGASGAYYIAAAADEIYADKASMVGSIGVVVGAGFDLTGFGFVEAMEKMGIERRVIAAGENKAILDPFSPLESDQVQRMKKLLSTIHDQFIDAVKSGRGDRLDTSADLFTGLVWSGEQAVELGLVDGLASPGTVARDLIGEENIVDYTVKPGPFERFARQLGMGAGEVMQGWLGSQYYSLR